MKVQNCLQNDKIIEYKNFVEISIIKTKKNNKCKKLKVKFKIKEMNISESVKNPKKYLMNINVDDI